MIAFCYEVTGSTEVLKDIEEVVRNENMWISWKNFNTGDTYWTGSGVGYMVSIDHAAKTVEFKER